MQYSSTAHGFDRRRQEAYLWLALVLSVCTWPVMAFMEHLKRQRDVFNREADEGEESFKSILVSAGFYLRCAMRLLHPWPWLVGRSIETGTVEKQVSLVYGSNDVLHVVCLLYAMFSLVRLVDISEWGRHSKVRIA